MPPIRKVFADGSKNHAAMNGTVADDGCFRSLRRISMVGNAGFEPATPSV